MTRAARVAAALRLTEGQLYTVASGLIVALVLLVLGLPSLRDIAPRESAALSRTSPLPLPGGPAVTDIITAPGPEPADDPLVGGGVVAAGAGTESVPSAVPEDSGPQPFTPPPPGPRPADQPPIAVEATPLHVQFARYASASGPLLPGGAPGEYLPVALRLGAPDKQSYLRLRGTGTTLRVLLSAQPAHQIGTAPAIRACRITAPDWQLEDGSALASAPKTDPVDCALGRPGDDGWTFELANVDIRHGIALVPSGPSTGSFQVTFKGKVT